MTAHKAHAEELQTYYFAPMGARLGAWFIDGVILSIAVVILGFILGLFVPILFGYEGFFEQFYYGWEEAVSALPVFLIFAWIGGGILYHTAMLANYGQTLGKMMCGIKVLTVEGTQLTWGTSFLRAVCAFLLSRQVFWLGYIWAFFQPQHQTWHDMIARTFVVKA